MLAGSKTYDGGPRGAGEGHGPVVAGKGEVTRGLHVVGTGQVSQEKSFEVVLVIPDPGAVRLVKGS